MHLLKILNPTPQTSTLSDISKWRCGPAGWVDVLTFLVFNILTPAVTVRALPGQSLLDTCIAIMVASLFPILSSQRGLDALCRHAFFADSDLHKAHKAGALCEVVRADGWRPLPEDYVRGLQKKNIPLRRDQKSLVHDDEDPLVTAVNDHADWSATVINDLENSVPESSAAGAGRTPDTQSDHPTSIPRLNASTAVCEIVRPSRMQRFKIHNGSRLSVGRKVHGICCLPSGYELAVVDQSSVVSELNDIQDPATGTEVKRTARPIQLSSSHNVFVIIGAAYRLLGSFSALYKFPGEQFVHYGIGASWLVTLPYLLMSLINFTGALATPDYSAVYMIHTEIMEEASKRDHAAFYGVVGTMEQTKDPVNALFATRNTLKDRFKDKLKVTSRRQQPMPQREETNWYTVPAHHTSLDDIVFHKKLSEQKSNRPTSSMDSYRKDLRTSYPVLIMSYLAIGLAWVIRMFTIDNLDDEHFFNQFYTYARLCLDIGLTAVSKSGLKPYPSGLALSIQHGLKKPSVFPLALAAYFALINLAPIFLTVVYESISVGQMIMASEHCVRSS